MKCLSDLQIQAFIDNESNRLEKSIHRNHFNRCPECRRRLQQYQVLEKALATPVFCEPPASIIKNVTAGLYLARPPYLSISVLLAASFMLLISWIHIYFDLASNSLVKTLQSTSTKTFSWFFDVLQLTGKLFSFVQAGFKIIRHLAEQIPFILGYSGKMPLLLTLAILLSLVLMQQYKSRKTKENAK